MELVSRHDGLSVADLRRWLAGFPRAEDYRVVVKPLRYRGNPSLSALTELESRRMTLQVPEPFFPFGEVIAVGAVRLPGTRLRFVTLTEGITFTTPREVVRFLYLHEFMHAFLYDRTGRGASAETTCDRFAIRNFRRRVVTLDDAEAAMSHSLPRLTEPRAARRRHPKGR
ncbi:MAG: hypothetical protein ACKO8G_05415 [Actinomycetota bacterium]